MNTVQFLYFKILLSKFKRSKSKEDEDKLVAYVDKKFQELADLRKKYPY